MQKLRPRSPYEKLGGYVHLPRLIDKAKLHRKGLLDGYNYKTVGFDKHLLAFLRLNPDKFEGIANELLVGCHRLEKLTHGKVQALDRDREHPVVALEQDSRQVSVCRFVRRRILIEQYEVDGPAEHGRLFEHAAQLDRRPRRERQNSDGPIAGTVDRRLDRLTHDALARDDRAKERVILGDRVQEAAK